MANGADLLFGPMLIGVFLNCILHGMLIVQTLVYYQSYKDRDALWIKMFVFYLLICETVNTVCDVGVVYEPLIIRYATPRALVTTPIMLRTDAVTTVMISTPVQIFIAWRVKILGRSIVLPAIICFFAITSFVGGVATSVGAAIWREYALFPKFKGAPITWLASSAAADVVITGSLVYNLMRRRTGFAVSDDLINRIIQLTVHTGLITTMSVLIDVTLPATLPNTSLNFICDFALSKLYSNSLLSTLNARGGWKVTTSLRDNVLFGGGNGGESTTRTRTQIELVVSDPDVERPVSMVPMTVFGSGGAYRHEASSSVITVPQKVAMDA